MVWDLMILLSDMILSGTHCIPVLDKNGSLLTNRWNLFRNCKYTLVASC